MTKYSLKVSVKNNKLMPFSSTDHIRASQTVLQSGKGLWYRAKWSC